MDKAPQLFVGIFEQTPDPEEIEWAHRHTYYSIVWFTSGKGFNVIDFSAYELLPNRFFTMNPHQVHNWEYSQNAQGFFVLVAPALALELSLHFSTPYTDLPVDDLPFVHTLFSKMQQQTDSKKQTIALQYFISLLENNKGEILVDFHHLRKRLLFVFQKKRFKTKHKSAVDFYNEFLSLDKIK